MKEIYNFETENFHLLFNKTKMYASINKYT